MVEYQLLQASFTVATQTEVSVITTLRKRTFHETFKTVPFDNDMLKKDQIEKHAAEQIKKLNRVVENATRIIATDLHLA